MTDNPSKLYHSISEVAKLTGVKAHVLRYWESEFSTLSPRKTRSGARRYRQNDIDEVRAIKQLLYEEGFKIAGARKVRRQAHRKVDKNQIKADAQLAMPFARQDLSEQLASLRKETTDILRLVQDLRIGGPAKKAKARAKTPGSAPTKKGKKARKAGA